MQVLNEFWFEFLELLYFPFQSFFGASYLSSFIVLVFFYLFQFWLFYHLLIKPFFEIFKLLFNVPKNRLWTKGVEYGEKKY